MTEYWAVKDAQGVTLWVGHGPPGSATLQIPPEGGTCEVLTSEQYEIALAGQPQP